MFLSCSDSDGKFCRRLPVTLCGQAEESHFCPPSQAQTELAESYISLTGQFQLDSLATPPRAAANVVTVSINTTLFTCPKLIYRGNYPEIGNDGVTVTSTDYPPHGT